MMIIDSFLDPISISFLVKTKSYYDDDVQLGSLHLVVTWAVRAAMGRRPRLTTIIINTVTIDHDHVHVHDDNHADGNQGSSQSAGRTGKPPEPSPPPSIPPPPGGDGDVDGDGVNCKKSSYMI